MAQGTVIHVTPEQPTYAVCVLGTEPQLDVCGSAPTGCTFFSINASPGVVVDVAHGPPAKKNPTGSSKWPLDPGLEVSLRMRAASSSMGDQKVQISYYGPQTNPVHALLYLTGVEITLSADITRTGKVKPTKAGKNQSTWTWGPRGQGAILLVNCDRDNPHTSAMDCTDDRVPDGADVQDMSLVTLSTRTPRDFFSKHQLVLHVAKSEMDKVRVFQASYQRDSADIGLATNQVLDSAKASPPPGSLPWPSGLPSSTARIALCNADCLRSSLLTQRLCTPWGPGQGRSSWSPQVSACIDVQDMSLVTLSTRTPRDFFSKHQLVLHVAKSEMDKVRVFQASLTSQQLTSTCCYELPKALVFQDSVAFRVAPWIMTPNTQPPKEVYVCRIFENEDFVKSLTALAKKARCKLTVCPLEESMEDQWMQDEIEIGYIQAPHKALPVVFDSPRNRGLKEFPVKCLLGPDFGYVTRGPQTGGVTNLDSFGNLEVSPPVTVGKKKYPLGRILIGHSMYPSAKSQEMHQALQDFLAAQQVQAPVKLYSDWLYVGHVDEFLSFVPAHKGFRLLLASPRSCYKLFQEQLKEGHGEALLFEGVKNKRQQKIKDILSNKKLREHNSYVESCIDWNREVLKRELGLRERDIVDIPQLFKLRTDFTGTPKAEALFPNMVNMLVLGKYLGIPKPFGPIINGRCCLEEKVRSLLEPLGLHCTFIDDFTPYHLQHGEVHCGTNVRRQPFSFKWWHMVP
ncbi:PREDICTED: protein-arginine deiminase type-4 [Myotis brandtii]|uniref:protein-arginine deiminase type-4 n=1 Tax=Myotis brandtii TaxID=109478 RepID=UPI000703D618|nr:PREDICTED: protein-arginine deiminase type-4 [Myotis brandtii]